MKRDIKFRLWLSNIYRMSYTHTLFDLTDILSGLITYDGIIPLQFTGIKDKNGVEIYEGDYLVDRWPVDDNNPELGYNESLLPVVWDHEELQWCVDTSFSKDGSHLSGIIDYYGEFLEVKGNIYQNPVGKTTTS